MKINKLIFFLTIVLLILMFLFLPNSINVKKRNPILYGIDTTYYIRENIKEQNETDFSLPKKSTLIEYKSIFND